METCNTRISRDLAAQRYRGGGGSGQIGQGQGGRSGQGQALPLQRDGMIGWVMAYDPDKQQRRSIRLPDYDYAEPGAYFVTICTQGRECVLGDPIVSGIISDVWQALPRWFPSIELDEFVVMPNHCHFILWICRAATGVDAKEDRVGADGAEADGAGAHGAGADGAGADGAGADGAGAHGAGASPAPTGRDVGATLAVAPDAVAPDAVVPYLNHRAWVIPEPTAVKAAPVLGDVVGVFKSLIFAAYLDWVRANDPARRAKFWQRNYYEHVIRSESELQAIRRYIRENPLRWALDADNPQNLPSHPYPAKVEEYLSDVA